MGLCALGFEIYMLIHTDEAETHVRQLQHNVDILHVAERVRFLVLVFHRFLSTLDPRSSFLFHLSFLFVKSEPSPVNVAEEAQAMRKVPAIILCVSQFTEWEGAKFALAHTPLFETVQISEVEFGRGRESDVNPGFSERHFVFFVLFRDGAITFFQDP